MDSRNKSGGPDNDEFPQSLQADLSRLQERLLGKGLLRKFLEERVTSESQIELACSSPAFVAAASGLIRSDFGAQYASSNFAGTGQCLRNERLGRIGMLSWDAVEKDLSVVLKLFLMADTHRLGYS